MFSRKQLKLTPFLILTALNLVALASLAAHAGGTSGGGGDASESRVNEIRTDILKWISEGGAQGLRLPVTLTLASYEKSMSSILAPHAVVVGFVTATQEAQTNDPELSVSVNGQPKTCRGFVSQKDSRPHILCNSERFAQVSESKQYQLIHHEYAGLAGVEQNVGASSDYVVSSQITDYLVPETVLRLSVKKPSSVTKIACKNSKGTEVISVNHSNQSAWGSISGYLTDEGPLQVQRTVEDGDEIYIYSRSTKHQPRAIFGTVERKYDQNFFILNRTTPSKSYYGLTYSSESCDFAFGIKLGCPGWSSPRTIKSEPISCTIQKE